MRAAIAAVLEGTYTDWNVSPYYLAAPQAPQLDILWGPVIYDTAMKGGDDEIHLCVRATVGLNDVQTGQEFLDPLLDGGTAADGLKNVLQGAAWGGTISAIKVTDVSEPKVYSAAGSDLMGVEFMCRVYP